MDFMEIVKSLGKWQYFTNQKSQKKIFIPLGHQHNYAGSDPNFSSAGDLL